MITRPGLNGHLVSSTALAIGTIGDRLIANTVLMMRQYDVKTELGRDTLRKELDGFAKGLIHLKSDIDPKELPQVYAAVKMAYVHAYGGSEATAKRHGLYERKTFKALTAHFGVTESGTIGEITGEIGIDVVQNATQTTELGLTKFLSEVGIDVTLISASSMADQAGAGGGDRAAIK